MDARSAMIVMTIRSSSKVNALLLSDLPDGLASGLIALLFWSGLQFIALIIPVAVCHNLVANTVNGPQIIGFRIVTVG